MFSNFEGYGFAGLSEDPADRSMIGGDAEVLLSWEVLIYAATHEYISRPDDTPADQTFLGTLDKAFRIERSIVGTSRVGEEVTIGLGEVKLNNYEHDYDFLSQDKTPLGQLITIRMGDRTRPYSEWRTILVGYMVDQQIDRDGVTFRVRDAGHLLDVLASPNVYAGTGSTEGGDDLKGKNKPRVFGWVDEWTAPLVMPSYLSYQLNDGRIQSVSACHVRGVAQVFSADYATVALMNAASLSVGHYATCLEAGWGRIAVAGGTELGSVTWNLAGDKAGDPTGVFVETSADIVKRLLTDTAGLSTDQIVQTTFDALNTAQPAPIGYGIPAGDQQFVSAAVASIMRGVGGWCGARRNSKFEVRRFEIPSGVPAGHFDRTNVADVKLGILPTDVSPPPWRVRVGWGRVWTTNQTNLAGSVSDDYRAYLSQDVRLASAEDINIQNDFPPGHELLEDKTYFRDEADALAEAERKLALWGTPRNLYVIPIMDRLYNFELGQVVGLQFDNRFDIDTEKLVRIVKVTDDDEEGVELWAVG